MFLKIRFSSLSSLVSLTNLISSLDFYNRTCCCVIDKCRKDRITASRKLNFPYVFRKKNVYHSNNRKRDSKLNSLYYGINTWMIRWSLYTLWTSTKLNFPQKFKNLSKNVLFSFMHQGWL